MSLTTKRVIIALLSVAFVASLLLVQYREVTRQRQQAGLVQWTPEVPAASQGCVDCHATESPDIVASWGRSGHAVDGVACVDCHQALPSEPDSFEHYGARIATVVTPRDCARCHEPQAAEFARSRHARAAGIEDSLQYARAVAISRRAHPDVASAPAEQDAAAAELDGSSGIVTSCRRCHGARVTVLSTARQPLGADAFDPGPNGEAQNHEALGQLLRDERGAPVYQSDGWPNAGIGRVNLDGSLGSCSPCHGRHEFSRARARDAEGCGRCHRGIHHAQLEIYTASKHASVLAEPHPIPVDRAAAARPATRREHRRAAPTCATCHLSATRQGEAVTHDPAQRIAWSHRPAVSARMDTNEDGALLVSGAAGGRVADSWQNKRQRMRGGCLSCHGPHSVDGFFDQYDALVVWYNDRYARPGRTLLAEMRARQLLTDGPFDDPIEWIWFDLHHEPGRRLRHAAAMMAPVDIDGLGLVPLASRFYGEFLGEARAVADRAARAGHDQAAREAQKSIEQLLARPEHRGIHPPGSATSLPAREPKDVSNGLRATPGSDK